MRVKFSSVFCLILMSQLQALAQTEIPNPGPRSAAQAKFLFEEGSQALVRKDFALAEKDFERFLARYPTDEKVQSAYLFLMEALFSEKKDAAILPIAKEFFNLKSEREATNRVRAYLAQSQLNLHHYLDARLSADELIKNEPSSREKAIAYSVQFQTLLEEKQYRDAHPPLDLLSALLEKEPIEPFVKMLPEFKMTLAMRECTVSHLLKNKEFSEDETTDYFTQKNLCFKSALPTVISGVSEPVLHEWCEDFTFLNHELQKPRFDPFLKDKLQHELKLTFEFSTTLSPELAKCYEPYKPPVKNKKRHRKRRIHSS